MASTKSWIKAMRLRTLPLSMATIITGNFLAFATGYFSWLVFVFSVLTTIALQILSNLANDLGDHLKGTDNENRVGPSRATQTGEISVQEMKNGIYLFVFLALVFGVSLLFFSKLNLEHFIYFLILGLASIAAAIFYTIGKNAYGYKAMGDLFVFIFFGLVGVGGSFYLQTGTISYQILLPAATIGFFSAGVLNLNNLRDHDNDKASNKNTLVVLLGIKNGKIYHYSIIFLSWLFIFLFVIINFYKWELLTPFITLPLFISHLVRVSKANSAEMLDPELKKLAIATFLFSILLAIGLSITW